MRLQNSAYPDTIYHNIFRIKLADQGLSTYHNYWTINQALSRVNPELSLGIRDYHLMAIKARFGLRKLRIELRDQELPYYYNNWTRMQDLSRLPSELSQENRNYHPTLRIGQQYKL
jgi:hypothetical protein